MSRASTQVKTRMTPRKSSAAAAPWRLRTALTKTVESTTALSMLAAHFFNQARNLFFLVLRALVTGRLFGMDTLQQCQKLCACLGAIDDRDGFEQNTPLDRFGFEVVAFLQMKLLPQLSRQGNLRGAFD